MLFERTDEAELRHESPCADSASAVSSEMATYSSRRHLRHPASHATPHADIGSQDRPASSTRYRAVQQARNGGFSDGEGIGTWHGHTQPAAATDTAR